MMGRISKVPNFMCYSLITGAVLICKHEVHHSNQTVNNGSYTCVSLEQWMSYLIIFNNGLSLLTLYSAKLLRHN